MKLHVEARATVPRPLDAVFDFAVDAASYAKILRPMGLFPGVERAEVLDGELREGARRDVHLTGGHVEKQMITTHRRPALHAYRWLNAPQFPFSLLVRGGEAQWSFSTATGSTTVVWHYRFELTSPLAAPYMLPLLLLFRRWMRSGLERIDAQMA